MISAQWVGGPHDGQWVELSSVRPLRVALPAVRSGVIPESDESLHLGPVIIEVRPELTREGWRLFWPKDAS